MTLCYYHSLGNIWFCYWSTRWEKDFQVFIHYTHCLWNMNEQLEFLSFYTRSQNILNFIGARFHLSYVLIYLIN